MIRYPIALEDLNARIDVTKPTWRQRAQARTRLLIAAGRYAEASQIWSEIKPVYMEFQYNKCLFCERKLAGPPHGLVEHDLEHFRPKSSVRVWPPQDSGLRFRFPTGGALPMGYYWLAYHVSNYGAVCKSCNSHFKSGYFPVKGTRGTVPADVAELQAAEQPLLLYPLGDGDDDPAQVIAFEGIVAVPARQTGHRHSRAKVIIEFFGLNRDELRKERSRQIVLLWFAIRSREQANGGEREAAQQLIDYLQSPPCEHSACARAFYQLWDAAPHQALQIFQAAHAELISSNDPVTRIRLP